MNKRYSIVGMTCGRCVKHVEGALKALPGVTQVQVSLNEQRAVIETATAEGPDDAAVVAAVVAAGYAAAVMHD